MRKAPKGFIWRHGILHANKTYLGRRIRGSTGTSDAKKAEQWLVAEMEKVRRQVVLGERRQFTFEQAAVRFITENGHLTNIEDYATDLRRIGEFIGQLPLEEIHDGTLAPYVRSEQQRRSARTGHAIRPKTINNRLQIVVRILNLAARTWRDGSQPWLAQAVPTISMLPVTAHQAKPYPLDFSEQVELFKRLPPLLARMARFAVNTGCREQEICQLQWAWYYEQDNAFVLPSSATKSKRERVVLLNKSAAQCLGKPVEGQGSGVGRVFARYVKARDEWVSVNRIHTSSWKRAWSDAGLPTGREHTKGVHNLRHTFARRLRSVGVPEETRAALLGHRTRSLTTHYSQAELDELRAALALLDAPSEGRLLRAIG